MDEFPPKVERRTAWALLVLRLTLGVFLLVWGLEKFVLPDRTVGIFKKFYGFEIGLDVTPILGTLECLLALALLLGAWRAWSYGIALLVHGFGVVATWREIIDPWGLIYGEVKHLFLAAVPVLGGFIALFLMRAYDVWTVDGWRMRTRPSPPPGDERG